MSTSILRTRSRGEDEAEESEDMHAPMAFLLGKLDFAREFRDFEVKQDGANFLVTAKGKTEKLPYDKIAML